MASKIEICNMALQNIGAGYITSLTENTKEALECNLRYDSARKALLEMHQWNFAMRRAALNPNVVTPAFNYPYEFALPSDFLYMVMTGLEEQYQSGSVSTISTMTHISNIPNTSVVDKYRIEGRNLISHSQDVKIIYVADITDTEQFSATFTQLLARYLGALIAYKVVGSKLERDSQITIFQSELTEYQAIDSQQGTFDTIQISEYLAAGY